MDAVRSVNAPTHQAEELRGDRQVQHEVLVALAECANHRKWFATFARPYLGADPIEIGTGLGDYALEWIPDVQRYTATEADPALFAGLEKSMACYPNVVVRQLTLPSSERASHSCLMSYNVLEHIADHVGALRSMGALVRPGGHIILVCPAFPFAMSAVDIATGHVRRYTRRSMRAALAEAGLEAVSVRYANSLGLICYYVFTSLLRKAPSKGATMLFYDRVVVPVVRGIERVIRPPFGQSVLAIARVPGGGARDAGVPASARQDGGAQDGGAQNGGAQNGGAQNGGGGPAAPPTSAAPWAGTP